jgi:ribosomal protein L2
VLISHPHLWPGKPIKELTIPLRRTGGRNHTGRVASRHIGGGHKRRLRTVDFYRYDSGVHDVIRIEYDPGRSAHIALLKKRAAGAEKPLKALTEEEIEEGMELAETEFGTPQDVKTFVPPHARALVRGGWSYILAPDGLRAGDEVTSFRSGIPVGIVDGWGRPSMDEMDDRMAQTELTRQRIQAEGGIVEPAGPQSVQPIDLKPNPDISSLSHGFLPSPRSLGLLRTAVLKIGNVLPLSLIPTGTVVHNISFGPRGKMQAARSAGCSATIVTHEDSTGLPVGGVDVLRLGGEIQSANGALAKSKGFVQVKMSSGEIRRFLPGSVATIGMVSK